MKYRKKPVVIEAIQFTGEPENIEMIRTFARGDISVSRMDPIMPALMVKTLEGELHASVGDYIIKGVHGEFYPCKPGIFKATYEPAEGTGDWKDRFKAEYKQLKDRYDKLHSMCIKYEAGTLDFEPNCPLALLKEQKAAMGHYLRVLEVRGEIEKVDLKLGEDHRADVVEYICGDCEGRINE